MTFTEAAAEVLRVAGKPLHYREITDLAIEKNLLSHVGKSPEVTMGARLAALLKKEDKTNPIVRVKPGVFALREWEGKRRGRKTAAEGSPEDDADVEVNALEVEAAARPAPIPEPSTRHERIVLDEEDDDDQPILGSPEDVLRADLAASGADFFDDEDDDDQPILASTSSTATADAQGTLTDGTRRRRRRRRRRGGRGEGDERSSGPSIEGAGSLSGNAGDAEGLGDAVRDPLAPAPRPMVRDRQQILAGGSPTGIEIPLPPGEELTGRELADATVMVLSGFDRSQGPVVLRAVADALIRRGRLPSDSMFANTQLSAALRADNLRRQSTGLRPRFRFMQGPRIALTDWSLGGELTRLEQELTSAAERYREAGRRAMLRKVQELPGHALVELLLLALERVGMTALRPIRRAGAPGGEAHFAAIHRTGTDEIRTAVIIRKDGREVGRERVTDLRGALHHYGPATAGWVLTTGQVLSGAREEATASVAAPIALYDGIALCRILEDHDVGVIRTHVTTSIVDLELFENLRGS